MGLNKINFSFLVGLVFAVGITAKNPAALAQWGSPIAGTGSGPDQPAPLGRGDSVRAAGIGNTTNRPTDDAPHSAHPTQPLTDTSGGQAATETTVKEHSPSPERAQALKKQQVFKHDVETRLSQVSDRILGLENKAGLVAQDLKSSFQAEIGKTRADEKNVALKIQKLDQRSSQTAQIRTEIALLEKRVGALEKKYSK